jgi:hypothetical protein
MFYCFQGVEFAGNHLFAHNWYSDRNIFQMTEWKMRVTEFLNSHYRQAQVNKISDKSI